MIIIETGFDGLGFMERDTVEFNELHSYLRQRQREVCRNDYPAQGEQLLTQMTTDVDGYASKLRSDGDLRRAPILASIDPERFVTTVISLPSCRAAEGAGGIQV